MAGRIFITGGSGFIGTHLCDAVLARGDGYLNVDVHALVLHRFTGTVTRFMRLLAVPCIRPVRL